VPNSGSLIDILDPNFSQAATDYETQLTQKLVTTFFVALLAAQLVTVALDRNRRG
jgi:lipopolysaccharide export LptBFGC system permease protein LptF